MTQIGNRKADHIRICLEKEIAPEYNYWNDIKLMHNALPEIDADKIDTSAYMLGEKLDMPLIVTAITGGFPGAEKINSNIAEACAELGIGMGVGSERAGVADIDKKSYEIIKEYDVPLVIGNIGAPQLVKQKDKKAFTVDDISKAIDLVDADAIAIHLNFLQEVVQPEGDTNGEGCYDAIKDIARQFPTIVKETGAGISKEVAERLKGIGIRGIDVAGMGGTSFSAVEMYRAEEATDDTRSEMGRTFFDWGIPTPVSLIECRNTIPLIASGGVITGMDIARSIAMGACGAGCAGAILTAANESAESVKDVLSLMKAELVGTMMLTGSANIKQLSKTRYSIIGKTAEWLEGYKWMQ